MPVNYFESVSDEPDDREYGKQQRKSGRRGSFLSFLSRETVDFPDSPTRLDDDTEEEEDEDPVMAHFRARSTKVRFSIDPASTPPVVVAPREAPKSPTAIRRFMKGALFGGNRGYYQEEAAKEIEKVKCPSSPTEERSDTSHSDDTPFHVDPSTATIARVTKHLNKARRALHVHHQYAYAVKCHMKSLNMLKDCPSDHPLLLQTREGLQQAHQIHSSFEHSAKIVRMGLRAEEQGELVRALKMYTIAYRMRRDSLRSDHPSLIVLLNMMGSIQLKRGELEEAMQIYELVLTDLPENSDELTRSVTYREMGSIYEQWGDSEKALDMYHQSLHCIAAHKGMENYETPVYSVPTASKKVDVLGIDDGADVEGALHAGSEKDDSFQEGKVEEQDVILADLEKVRIARSYARKTQVVNADMGGDAGGMELMLGLQKKGKAVIGASHYDAFFPPALEQKIRKKGSKAKEDDSSEVDAAVTLHYIAQMHRNRGEYNLALAAFDVALRGMKYTLGKYHPNVAAILGNMGNMRKEMGDMDKAFSTYQQVLAIESYRLGLNHPDVTVTLHNIATIDAARGNHEHALALYQQVLGLQCKLFGDDDESLAVTSACMGDVYERMGDVDRATDCFEEALRIKIITQGRHSLEVARLFHKLGKLCVYKREYKLAEICVSKSLATYRLNNLVDTDEWIVEAKRDAADIGAAIAMARAAPEVAQHQSTQIEI